ncbi:TonB-dependent receptor [Erythrobacter sp. LQ02-29]|uniref:TonB-dependent receptor n=1 Tax=Erythrobacter sp. LQ02-29 TaxID=2920384 RepID=UPI001F4EC000|nr:TonB-dependent receptor [Erythrobacter sp. LQ02-29]MCP9223563.1 TonB-dependent receptor [Erythrobacter sp. LQ02-29]
MRNLVRLSLLLGTQAIWVAPASAQTTAPVDERQPEEARRVELNEIVVTAQRREQSLQDVPISVRAFDAEAIAALNAQTVGDLDAFTPGLEINDTSVTQPRFSIRGVVTDDFGIGTEPSVGIFIDNVYSARTGASLIFFNDVERVEVLKGPQGTLFGRNTSAGAISITTNKPSQRVEAFGTVQYGNYDQVRIDATGNLPLTDTLAVRLNGSYNHRDGYLTDALTGEDREREGNISGRIAFGWTPTVDTDVYLTYDHDDTDKDGPTAVGISPYALSQDPFGPFSNDVINDRETRNLDGVTLTANHRLGDLTLTSISAYKTFETHNREDEDGTADPTRYFDTENIEHNESFYQEFRGSYEGERLTLLLGASYFWEDAEQTSAVTFLTDSVDNVLNRLAGLPLFTILQGQGLPVLGLTFEEDMNNFARNNSYAVYGDATYSLTDDLRLTAGIRYTHDDKRFTWLNGRFISAGLEAITAPGALYNGVLAAIGSDPVFPDGADISVATFYDALIGDIIFDEGALEGARVTRDESFDDVSPRFVIEYEPREDLLVYASAARGYKAGGFNSTEINSFFEPENVWNYEAGFKSELLGRRLRFNGSAFYFKYKNRQSISLEDDNTCTEGLCLPMYVTRSGDSDAWGIDLETQFRVSNDLTLSAIASYLDSRWVTRIERGIDISGQPTGAPELTAVLGAHYDHELANTSAIFADASYSYTGRGRLNDATRDKYASISNLVRPDVFDELDEPRNLINARVGWRSPGDRYQIALFVENLLDDQKVRTLGTLSAGTFQTPYVRLDKPRFYGISLSASY